MPPIQNPQTSNLRKRLVVSSVLTLPVMLVSMLPALQFSGWQWVVALLAFPVATWGAWPFHRAAFQAGKHGGATMDTLVSLGVIAAMCWSLWALFFTSAGAWGHVMHMSFLPQHASDTHPEIYFETAAVVTTFLLAGRFAESFTRAQAGDALRKLLELGAKTAWRETSEGVVHEVSTADLLVGDLVLVKPGEKIPADGVVESGSAMLDTSLLTGESVPVAVSVGTTVAGGTINTDGSLRVRLTAVGADTTLAQIAKLVTEAQLGKAPVQRLADRVSGVFVPVVLLISAATLLGWLWFGSSVQAAFTAAVAVLVIACPCALGLATPTALLVGSGRASQLGIVIKGAEILESTKQIDTILLDKTGTITSGQMRVESFAGTPGVDFSEGVALAAAVEAHASHPIAQAITDFAATPSAERNTPFSSSSTPLERNTPSTVKTVSTVCYAPGEEFQNHAGLGASASVSGKRVFVGSERFLTNLGFNLDSLAAEIESGYKQGATVVLAGWVSESELAQKLANTIAERNSPETVASLSETPERNTLQTLTESQKDSHMNETSNLVVELAIQGMTCASCVNRVERKLHKLPGVEAQVNLATETGRVTLRGGQLVDSAEPAAELIRVIEKAGYQARVISFAALEKNTDFPTTDVEYSLDCSEFSWLDAPAVLQQDKQISRELLGVFQVSDAVKSGSARAISQLRELGVEPLMLTGDNQHSAERVAREVGIDRVFAQVSPADKRDVVAQLQTEGRVVAMVGDGVNDAAALAQAGVRGLGIAMGSGTDSAIEAADITLIRSDLLSVPTSIRISRATLRVIKQNLFWAFAYNVAAIPLAVAGLLNPMIAGAAMACSSVLVVSNSLRLRRFV